MCSPFLYSCAALPSHSRGHENTLATICSPVPGLLNKSRIQVCRFLRRPCFDGGCPGMRYAEPGSAGATLGLFFFGFFASRLLRCCPLAMVALLDLETPVDLETPAPQPRRASKQKLAPACRRYSGGRTVLPALQTRRRSCLDQDAICS